MNFKISYDIFMKIQHYYDLIFVVSYLFTVYIFLHFVSTRYRIVKHRLRQGLDWSSYSDWALLPHLFYFQGVPELFVKLMDWEDATVATPRR